jgi:hypothetical protein
MVTTMFDVTLERDADNRIAAFRIGERWIGVLDIIDRWPGEDHLYLKLRCAGGEVVILRQDTSAGTWEMTMFDAQGRQ